MSNPESSKIDGLAEMGQMLDKTNPEQSGELIEGQVVNLGKSRFRQSAEVGGALGGIVLAAGVAGAVDRQSAQVDAVTGPELRVPHEAGSAEHTYVDPNGVTITPSAEGGLQATVDHDSGTDPVGEENADEIAPSVNNTIAMAEAKEAAQDNLPEPNAHGDESGGLPYPEHGGAEAQ